MPELLTDQDVALPYHVQLFHLHLCFSVTLKGLAEYILKWNTYGA